MVGVLVGVEVAVADGVGVAEDALDVGWDGGTVPTQAVSVAPTSITAMRWEPRGVMRRSWNR